MAACPTPRTYFVVSPETDIVADYVDFGLGSQAIYERGCYVDEVQASSKREAIRTAYADPAAEIHQWAKVARGDGKHPFAGVTAEHPHCEHGTCLDQWDGAPTEADCPECFRLDAEPRP